VAEVLPVTDEIKVMINDINEWHKIKDMFKQMHLMTLKQNGMVKALTGVTTIEEILRVTKD
jgi:type II secretory ATPase GspE/PulE/Tfp pilus assembly ATPase PilB-like protein